MDIRIRPATEEDYDGINRVFADELAHHAALLPHRFQVTEPVMTRPWFFDVLAHPNKALRVAVVDGRLVGLILLLESVSLDDPIYRPRRYLEVDEIAVLVEYRGQGIGRRLMETAEHIAVERNIDTIELDVWQANAQAVAFYDHLGYRTIRCRMARQLTGKPLTHPD